MSGSDADGTTAERPDRRTWLRRPATPCRRRRSGPCRSSGTTPTCPSCASDGRADDHGRDRAGRVRGLSARRRVPRGGRAPRRAGGPRPAARGGLCRVPATVDGPVTVRSRRRSSACACSRRATARCCAWRSTAAPDRDATAGRAIARRRAVADRRRLGADRRPPARARPATRAAGRRMAFHPHVGTYVETPDEVDRLVESTDPDLVPDLPRRRALPRRRRRSGGGPADARRAGDPRPPEGRRPGRARRSALGPRRHVQRRRPRADLHRARVGRAGPRRGDRRARRPRLRRLAHGRAGQHLGPAVRERRDRPAGAGVRAHARAGAGRLDLTGSADGPSSAPTWAARLGRTARRTRSRARRTRTRARSGTPSSPRPSTTSEPAAAANRRSAPSPRLGPGSTARPPSRAARRGTCRRRRSGRPRRRSRVGR